MKGSYRWPKSLHEDDKQLLMRILEPDPTKRYTSTQILRHKLIDTALKSDAAYVKKYVSSKDGLLRPTPYRETIETLKRRREQMSESARRRKFEAEAEMYNFQYSSSSSSSNRKNNSNWRGTNTNSHDYVISSNMEQDNNVRKFRRVNSGDSVHSDTTKYSNSSIDSGKISSDAGDLARKMADRILRQVLGVSTVNGSGTELRESHRSALIKDGAKYSVTARLKMIDDLTSSTR